MVLKQLLETFFNKQLQGVETDRGRLNQAVETQQTEKLIQSADDANLHDGSKSQAVGGTPPEEINELQ